MRIKIVQSITDINGDQLPPEMIGKEYDVIKENGRGVWVKEGKMDAFVHYEELEIVELSAQLAKILGHYLRTTAKDKFEQELKSMGCTHLI
ncbi:hypothetical protein ACFVSW_08665 [Neobacillus sp. NPDC058068]|uniref:hypothetical protein n=1 Tax=Neobacillus sp. NPDC058068 TaxID=3346325 RepID=UPI0036DC2ED7